MTGQHLQGGVDCVAVCAVIAGGPPGRGEPPGRAVGCPGSRYPAAAWWWWMAITRRRRSRGRPGTGPGTRSRCPGAPGAGRAPVAAHQSLNSAHLAYACTRSGRQHLWPAAPGGGHGAQRRCASRLGHQRGVFPGVNLEHRRAAVRGLPQEWQNSRVNEDHPGQLPVGRALPGRDWVVVRLVGKVAVRTARAATPIARTVNDPLCSIGGGGVRSPVTN
jgi:hypothetical protein